jgi:hypothetical protein
MPFFRLCNKDLYNFQVQESALQAWWAFYSFFLPVILEGRMVG